MKKPNLFVAAGALLMTACNSQPSYTLQGSVPENVPEGTPVYVINAQDDTLHTALVKNHAFELKGQTAEVQECMVTIRTDKQQLSGSLLLENGKLKLALEENKVNSATGTPLNDAASQYYNAKRALRAQMSSLGKKCQDESLDEAARAEAMKQLEGLEKQNLDLIRQTITQNIQNPLGVSLMTHHASSFGMDELQAWIGQIPANLKDEKVAKVQEHIDAIKSSSVGKKYHEIVGATPQGEKACLSQFVGKSDYLLVDFWASWCYPCRKEMANLAKFYQKYHQKGLDMVSISLDTDDYLDKWKTTIQKLDLTWHQMRMDMLSRGHKQYGISSIPCIIVLDKEGTIVARNLVGEELEKKLEELMK